MQIGEYEKNIEDMFIYKLLGINYNKLDSFSKTLINSVGILILLMFVIMIYRNVRLFLNPKKKKVLEPSTKTQQKTTLTTQGKMSENIKKK